MQPDIASIMERVDILERENRRIKLWASLAVVVVGLLAVAGHFFPLLPQDITCRSIVVGSTRYRGTEITPNAIRMLGFGQDASVVLSAEGGRTSLQSRSPHLPGRLLAPSGDAGVRTSAATRGAIELSVYDEPAITVTGSYGANTIWPPPVFTSDPGPLTEEGG
jgi:hypothetical protein